MRGLNFINPANNRTLGSNYTTLYDMRDALPNLPTEDDWKKVHTKLPFPKYPPPPKPFYIGDTGSKRSVDTKSNNMEKLRVALRAYDNSNTGIDYKNSVKKCYNYIDRHTGEKYRIPCSLAEVLKKVSKISDDDDYKDMVEIELVTEPVPMRNIHIRKTEPVSMRKKRKNESMIEKIKKIYDHELTSIFVGKHVYDNIDNEIVTITNLVMSGSTLYAYVKKKGDTQRICKDIINLYMKPGITRFKSHELVTLKKVYERIVKITNSRSKELKHMRRTMGNYLVDFNNFMLYNIYNYI
jgi:hypothetical protein